jgi:hypothetical protein
MPVSITQDRTNVRDTLITVISSQVATPERFHQLFSAAYPNMTNMSPDDRKSIDNIASLSFSKENLSAMEALKKYGYDFSARRWYRPEQLKQFIAAISNRVEFRGIDNTLQYRPVNVIQKALEFGTDFKMGEEHLLDYMQRKHKSKTQLLQVFKHIYKAEIEKTKKSLSDTGAVLLDKTPLANVLTAMVVDYLRPEWVPSQPKAKPNPHP